LYRLRDIAPYWQKIAKFLYPTCIYRPCRSRRNFVKMYDADKTTMIGLPYGEKTMTISLAIFIQYWNVTDEQTDGQTNGQTDRITISISRVSVLMRDKNPVRSVQLV